MTPEARQEAESRYFVGLCPRCGHHIVRKEYESKVGSLCGVRKLMEECGSWDHGSWTVCGCPPDQIPAQQSFFDSWLNSVENLGTALERAKLRHDINEALPADLKPFGSLLGILVDPTGAAVEMSQKYWEKQAAEKRAAAAVAESKRKPRRAPRKKTKKKGKRR